MSTTNAGVIDHSAVKRPIEAQAAPASQSTKRCLICRNEYSKLPANCLGTVAGNTERFKNVEFEMWQCPLCLSIQATNPVDFDEIYQDYPLNSRTMDLFALLTYRNLYQRLHKAGLRPYHTVLDYGCGNGLFIQYLTKKGFDSVQGFDPYVPGFEQHPKPGQKFDCVVINDTIEHARDYHGLIADALQYLKPGGLLYIGTPDITGVKMNELHQHATKMHQPFHQIIVSKEILIELGKKRGLSLVNVYQRSYLDTLFPFANYRFLDELCKAVGNNLDRALGPAAMKAILGNPKIIFYAFFGYFFPSAYEPAVIFRKERSPRVGFNTKEVI